MDLLSVPPTDLSALCARAAQLLAEPPRASLPLLSALAASAVEAEESVVYLYTPEGLLEAVGADNSLLRDAAQAAMQDWRGSGAVSGALEVRAVALVADAAPLGVWAVQCPARWAEGSPLFLPMLTAAARQVHWEEEMQAARRRVERAIREVAAVYEIGQAMDKVEIDRLLDMITEKATEVMDAQACSLLLRLPDTDALVIAASYGLPEDVIANTHIVIGDGIAGQVAASGEPLRMHGGDTIASSVCMPMKDESGRVQGVLCIRRLIPDRQFSDEDLRLFSIFATQAGLAINNAQLYAKLNHKIQELSTLSALTEAVSSTLDLDQVLNQVADNIIDVVHFDRCRIYLADSETGRFRAQIRKGFRWGKDSEEAEYEIGEGLIGMIAQSQQPILVRHLDTAPPEARQYAEGLGIDAFYAQPIVVRGRSIGVIVVSNIGSQRLISESSIGLLSTFVHQAGIAIENARFHAGQTRRYSELTTLYEVSKTLAATSGIQRTAQTVTDLAVDLTDSDAGLLLLYDPGQEALSALHWRGLGELLGRQLRAYVSPVRVAAPARALRSPRLLGRDGLAEWFGPDWNGPLAAFVGRHRSAALIPLITEDSCAGFLFLGCHGEAYEADALKLISVVSAQAAAVLMSAATYERRIGQRELELSAIYELMQKVRSAMTLEEALNSILDIVASLVWSEEASLYTLDDGLETMTVRAARGDRSEELVGRCAVDLSGGSLAARALRERNAILETEGVISVMALPLAVEGEVIGVLTMQSEIADLYSEENVRMLHLVASQAATIYRDMTSLRALTRYTDNILHSIAAGVLTIDKDGRIVTWNTRAGQIMGLPASQIIGRHFRDFIQTLHMDETLRREVAQMLELTAETGKVFSSNQLEYQTPNGEQVYLNLSASQLRSEGGEYLGVVVVFEDVTNEVLMKEEVERVTRLAETGQLAANIAHELRNPLSSIKGAAQLLRNELPDDLVAEHGEFLDIIVEEANGLNRITSEFLEFARATPPEMQPVTIHATLTRLLQFMSASLAETEVTIRYAYGDDIPEIQADRSQLEQVVRNIVINAAQAMPRGGQLTVATRFFPTPQVVEIAFTDTGHGIPPEKLGRIFTPFFTTKTKGTGLGLAIARKIIETHGGQLDAHSRPGEGATFTIHLPVKPPPGGLPPQSRFEISEQRSESSGNRAISPA